MIALSIVNEAVLKFNQQDNGDRTPHMAPQ
jgi:hypothetical protein